MGNLPFLEGFRPHGAGTLRGGPPSQDGKDPVEAFLAMRENVPIHPPMTKSPTLEQTTTRQKWNTVVLAGEWSKAVVLNSASPALVAGRRTIPGCAEERLLGFFFVHLPGATGQQQVFYAAGGSLLAVGPWLREGLWP